VRVLARQYLSRGSGCYVLVGLFLLGCCKQGATY